MNVMLTISCGAKEILILTRRIFYGKHHYRKFCVESEGFQALSELKARSVTNDYVVSQAIIAKNTEGSIRTLDGFDTGAQTSNDTAVGGLIGSLLGIAGGPLGMMIMGGYGALIGSAVDWSDAAEVAAEVDEATRVQEEARITVCRDKQQIQEIIPRRNRRSNF